MKSTKICTTCHIKKELSEFTKRKASKDGMRSCCKACQAKNGKRYYETNKEQIFEYQKQYSQNNKEKIAKRAKKWREENKECILEKKKQYYQNNKEHHAESVQQWREENKELVLKYSKKWREANKEYNNQYYQNNKEHILEQTKQYFQTPEGKAVAKAGRQNRRALVRNAQGFHTGKQVLELFDKQKGVCVYCKTKLNKSGNNGFHADHIMPLSKGGSNDISNIQLLCSHCNLSKHNKLPELFAQRYGMLI